MSEDRGAIRSEEAYALGKMLDHSDWQRGEKIARLITPSDVDACFDNNGNVIFCEFSSQHDDWSRISLGQRLLYQNCINGTDHLAVLCRHSVKASDGRRINSRTDIQSFQVMLHDRILLYSPVIDGNDKWQKLIQWWFEDAVMARRVFIGKAALHNL